MRTKLSLLVRQAARLVGLVVLIGLVLIEIDAHLLLVALHSTVPSILQNVKAGTDPLPATMESIKASAEMSKRASSETLDLLGSSEKFVTHATTALDSGIRGANQLFPVALGTMAKADGTIDAATATITKAGSVADSLGREVPKVSHSVQSSLAGVPAATLAAQHSLDAIAAVASDPNIPRVIEHLDGTAAGADETMAHVAHTSAYYDRQLTRPRHWWEKLRDTATAAGNFTLRHL